MLITRAEVSPPTMTMANGRCESDPMACESAAGNSPTVATSMVVMMGRSLKTAPSTAASTIERPRARSWLMYSSMITPVCTDTPNRARKPTPEDTQSDSGHEHGGHDGTQPQDSALHRGIHDRGRC